MRHLDVVMHMNIVCVIVLGTISLIRFHAPFAIWIAYCFVDECWMNRYSVLCSICNAFCNCTLFDVSYSNKMIWTWTWSYSCVFWKFIFGTLSNVTKINEPVNDFPSVHPSELGQSAWTPWWQYNLRYRYHKKHGVAVAYYNTIYRMCTQIPHSVWNKNCRFVPDSSRIICQYHKIMYGFLWELFKSFEINVNKCAW